MPNGQPQNNNRSSAPYGFVPPVNDDELKKHTDKQGGRRWSGELTVRWKTLTPLHIGDHGGEGVPYRGADGQFALPGSSLRGLLRTLYAIVVDDPLGPINQRRLFYRDFGTGTLKDLYQARTRAGEHREAAVTVHAGVAQKDSEGWKILETQAHIGEDGERREGSPPAQLPVKDDSNASAEIFSGHIDGKRWNVVVDLPGAQRTATWKVPQGVVDDFEDDRRRYPLSGADGTDPWGQGTTAFADGEGPKRSRAGQLLEGEPVFFTVKDGEVASIGRTLFHRVPHLKRVEEMPGAGTPEQMRESRTTALFGSLDDDVAASRLRVADAPLQSSKPEHLGCYSLPLLSPKPTFLRHYLRPKGGTKGQPHYDDAESAKLAGFKMYWHRCDGADVPTEKQLKVPDAADATENVLTSFSALPAGTEFAGPVRFWNLTDEELGALLLLCDLSSARTKTSDEPVFAVKLGKAQAFGLGSCAVTVEKAEVRADDDTQLRWHSQTLRRMRSCEIGECRRAFVAEAYKRRPSIGGKKAKREDCGGPADVEWMVAQLKRLHRRFCDFFALLSWAERPSISLTEMPRYGALKEGPGLPSPASLLKESNNGKGGAQ